VSVEQSPLEELAALVASVRAFVEWHESTGSIGIVRETRSPPPSRDPAPPPAVASVPPPARRVEPFVPIAAAPETVVRTLPVPAHEHASRLALLATQVEQCTRCDLHMSRARTVFARGNVNAELCFVGDRPVAEDEMQGEPFASRAGLLLDRMIAAMGYARADVYICNIIKCRPPSDRQPEPNELKACLSHVAEQLEILEPKVIVALGTTAFQSLLGTSEPIASVRGKWKLYRGRIPVMPTHDPAFVLGHPYAKREVWSDLQEAMRVLGKPSRSSG
jgi:DNA polymerase